MAKTKMKKGLKIAIITSTSLLVVVGVLLYVFLVLMKPADIPTYSFSGYVYADGEPLAGAKVSCGIMQTETNEDGYYKFDKLTKVVEVTVSKENYIFGNELVFVNDNKENVNFSGFELFSLNGIVMNGDEVIPFAEIKVISEAGVYVTRANAFGVFSLPRLAGEVSLMATHESVTLFSQTFDKTKEELVVTGTTTLTGLINADSTFGHDFVLKLNDEIIPINNDLTFCAQNVEPNSILTLESNNYYIENDEVMITIENGQFIFNVEKFYDISGVVVSGETPLANARIVVNSNKTYTNALGQFQMSALHGENILVTTLQGFTFDNTTINYEDNIVSVIGKFDLKGKVHTDDGMLSGINVVSGHNNVSTNSKGEFILADAQLGDIVYVDSDDYYVDVNNVTINSTASISFDLQKLYSASIKITYSSLPLPGVTAIIGQRSYTAGDNGTILVSGLYGTNNVSLNLDGYLFNKEYSTDYMHSSINVTPYKYFSVSGVVKSGDVVLSNAVVSIDGKDISVDMDGVFEVSNLYLSSKATVICDGYNSKVVDYAIDNSSLEINLDYDITGKVICGNLAVSGVAVSNGNSTTYTDHTGEFSFKGMTGSKALTFEKQYYSFESINVNNGSLVNIPCSYMITGKSTNKLGAISNLEILLVSSSDNSDTISVVTDDNGDFEVSGLEGEYLMIYDTDYSANLLPNGYTVNCGGIYNFSDSGYKIKGRVMSGDIPVGGVVVKAGDLTTITSEDGYYKFDLIIDDEVLELNKDGYTFINNNLPIDLSYDGREDVDFQCTYSISGIVSSGDRLLGGVKVTASDIECYSDSEGKYSISGLSGEVIISAEMENYHFELPSSISSTGVYNITAMFNTSVVVKTGNIPVEGVEITLNNNTFTTSSDGSASVIGIEIGDVLSFTKEGFVISSYTFSDNISSIEINATYSINGRIYITTRPLSGVKVEYNGIIVISDDNGYFEFEGLSGENLIAFTKDNYSFDNVNVSGYSELTIPAKYTITGNVSVAGAGLEDVAIKAGDITVYTDEHGYYTISNLKDVVVLEIEKYGYEFNGEYVASAPSVINIIATYRIAGRIMSGDIEIEGAVIAMSNGVTIKTNSSGYFECKGIEEVISLEISATNYNSAVVQNIDKFINDILVNLTYDLVINLTNITNLPDVTIKVGNNEGKYSTSQITFNNLTGTQKVSISKDGYDFSPAEANVSCQTTLNVVVKKEFGVSGTITTSSGLPVAGVTITASGKETITDSNGYYSLSPFIDPIQIKLVMKVVDTAYQGENYEYSAVIDQISTDAVKNYTIENESEYAFFLFKKGYQNLNDANSYQIFGEGTVQDDSTNESQDIEVIYKKDTKNHRIIQNLNWHDGKIMGLVDPRIVQLTYVDMNTKSIKYQTVTGSSVSKGTADWSSSWTSIDSTNNGTDAYEKYLNSYGVNAEGYYPYVINKNTISSTSAMTLANGVYSFTFSLNSSSYQYYTTQMAHMCSSQTFKSFTHCNITYTIGQDGYIRTMKINEQYIVSASIVTPNVTANITYNFLTNSPNEIINDISIGTDDEINAGLTQETPTYAVNSSNILRYDLYLEQRRKLV